MAAVNTQFSVAVHMMSGLGIRPEEAKTSSYLAQSVYANPSFVRRVLSKLAKAGLVNTTTGKTGACTLARRPNEISLLEIYNAVEAPKAFAIHSYPERRQCALSCNIKEAMGKVLKQTQRAMEDSLKGVYLSDVIADVRKNSS